MNGTDAGSRSPEPALRLDELVAFTASREGRQHPGLVTAAMAVGRG